MNITKRQLRRIISEIVKTDRDEDINPYGTGMEALIDPDENLDLIGHTWLQHGKIQDESLREALGIEGNPTGKITHHDLSKNGEISYYNLKINGEEYISIPARLVESIEETTHEHEERD